MKGVYICGGVVLIFFLVLIFSVLRAAARKVPPLPEKEASDDGE